MRPHAPTISRTLPETVWEPMSNDETSPEIDMVPLLPTPGCAATTQRPWACLAPALHRFKGLVAQADKAALARGAIPAALTEQVHASVRTLCLLMQQDISDSAPVAQ